MLENLLESIPIDIPLECENNKCFEKVKSLSDRKVAC
jgi:hypothetical protein